MSWQLYRALRREPYTSSERMLDTSWEVQNAQVQVLAFQRDEVRIRWMPAPAARQARLRMATQEARTLKNNQWAFYLWLRNRYGYTRDFADHLLEMRNNLEERNGSHA